MTTTVPPRLKSRPIDPRGYPIPFAQFIDPKTGLPDFRILDQAKGLFL